jgi:hypothetical protein
MGFSSPSAKRPCKDKPEGEELGVDGLSRLFSSSRSIDKAHSQLTSPSLFGFALNKDSTF